MSESEKEKWQEFYREYFDLTVDFSEIVVPPEKKGFNRIIFIPKDLTLRDINRATRKYFEIFYYRLGTLIERRVRKSYAIRIRDRVEADKELKNISAVDLKDKSIKTINLIERLVYELKYYTETGGRLDVNTDTLCAATCLPVGYPIYVGWNDNKLQVGWCYPGYAGDDLRARKVVRK